jgi:carboxymethylenebutenolidase
LIAACDHHSAAEKPTVSQSPPVLDASGDPHPELVAFPSGALTLHGFLWRPPGAGPFPTIVFNHGSEELPAAKEGQAAFFVSHGFVLFVPHRRGQGQSRNAGANINEQLNASGNDPSVLVAALVAQTDDVMAAVTYAGTLPYVDAKHVAAVGCSFGGIETLLAAERGTGLVAAIDFAGGAMTWASAPQLQDRMKLAARNAKVPVFFLQAENDFNTAPSLVLSNEMKSAGKPMRVHIFPPNGVTHEDGHAFCIGGQSPPWGNEVLDFLHAPTGLP